ncbi:placenta-specific protein 9 isoform X2 [Ursus maritimus]|uniref:Placenta-specific protein 9 isoform X2 n=2 Tax=Ursus TaxID=9639 RepID=A0A8M1F931_URSMA|nr:placenta-specific protein 9 isoform X2 [Ursus maritimus]
MRLWTEKSLRSGRRSGVGAAVCWAVKCAPGPLGGESRGREPSACVFPLSLLGRRPGWHAGPSAPGVSGGGGSREPESPEPPRNFGSGGEHFLRAGRRGPGGRGGGQTLRCAPPAGSMRPLLCALAGLALLRAAAAEPSVSSRGDPAWNVGCDRYMAVHDRLDVIEETVEKTVEHLEAEVKVLLGQLEELAWNLPPGPLGPTPDLFGDDGFGAPEPALPSSWK